ncbi:MAG: hypothetical protein METHAR1v1_40007 [Methanothrix sp.]|nr:MAG: hypothetical protein METHAR1v1_40007 [Methanothrix sp.]
MRAPQPRRSGILRESGPHRRLRDRRGPDVIGHEAEIEEAEEGEGPARVQPENPHSLRDGACGPRQDDPSRQDPGHHHRRRRGRCHNPAHRSYRDPSERHQRGLWTPL